MNAIAVILLAAAGGLLLFFLSTRAKAEDTPMTAAEIPTLDDVFHKYGKLFGVDPWLLKAIALQESSLNILAVNKTDNESIGLMQILCKPDGQGGCSNRFNVSGWEDASREKLFEPDFNVYIGSQILAWNISQYGTKKGIAVYNNWSMRNALPEGPFSNQAYVDSVLRKYSNYLKEHQ